MWKCILTERKRGFLPGSCMRRIPPPLGPVRRRRASKWRSPSFRRHPHWRGLPVDSKFLVHAPRADWESNRRNRARTTVPSDPGKVSRWSTSEITANTRSVKVTFYVMSDFLLRLSYNARYNDMLLSAFYVFYD